MYINLKKILFLVSTVFLFEDTISMEIENQPSSIQSVRECIVYCLKGIFDPIYIKANENIFNSIIECGVGLSPCAQVVLGMYYLSNENKEKATSLLQAGCSDQYEGYYYALQYLDDNKIESEGLSDYSRKNVEKVINALLERKVSKNSLEPITKEEQRTALTKSDEKKEKKTRLKSKQTEKSKKKIVSPSKEPNSFLKKVQKQKKKKHTRYFREVHFSNEL